LAGIPTRRARGGQAKRGARWETKKTTKCTSMRGTGKPQAWTQTCHQTGHKNGRAGSYGLCSDQVQTVGGRRRKASYIADLRRSCPPEANEVVVRRAPSASLHRRRRWPRLSVDIITAQAADLGKQFHARKHRFGAVYAGLPRRPTGTIQARRQFQDTMP